MSLLHWLSEAGYVHPWEMTANVFQDFVLSISSKAREEFDRIDRALHVAGDLSETALFYEELILADDPELIRRLRGISPNDTVRIFKISSGEHDREIRPGDFVALDKKHLPEPKKREKLVSVEAKAADVDWTGRGSKEWVYAPAACRNYDASVHDFLIAYAMQLGHFIPPDVRREYIMRV